MIFIKIVVAYGLLAIGSQSLPFEVVTRTEIRWEGCPLDNLTSVKCLLNGTEVSPSSVVDNGVYCYLDGFGGYICEDGTWSSPALENSLAQHRSKRIVLSVLSMKVIKWSVATAFGAVGACALFCPFGSAYVPPSITCPLVISPQTAKQNELLSSVCWDHPTTSCGSGSCSEVIETPGRNALCDDYGEGLHIYKYTYKETGQNYVTECIVGFVVEVIRCGYPVLTPHSYLEECNPPYSYWGTTCTIGCERGHTVRSGTGKVTCGEDAQFSQRVYCDRGTCATQPPKVENANFYCPGEFCNPHEYGCRCFYLCMEGYTGTIIPTECMSTAVWADTFGTCKDTEPPTIHDCPGNIEVYADPNVETAVVTWPEPTVSDNTNKPVTMEMEGGVPGSTFSGAYNPIIYTATDAAGNTATCGFNVAVNVISCYPIPYTDYMKVTCTDKLLLGAQCSFSCDLNLSLNGSDTSTCVQSAADPAKGEWNWGMHGYPSFCIVYECPDMKPPRNGALAYDTWLNGIIAYMFCSDKYDFPIQTPADGQYVCSLNNGYWTPPQYVPPPDCVERTGVNNSELTGNKNNYYSGDCNDPETQKEIQDNYIKLLNDSAFDSLCTDYEDCNAENVRVECGESDPSGRRKRSANTHVVTVLFDLVTRVDYANGSKDLQTVHTETNSRLAAMSYIIQQEVETGLFDLNIPSFPTTTDRNSYKQGVSALTCPPGMEENLQTYTCRPCATGTFYDRHVGSCAPCSVGTYQDIPGQAACKSCPEEMSTKKEGSTELNECLAACLPGHYSITGVVPCSACAPGEYQNDNNAMSCITCPRGRSSAAASSDCTTFDVRFEPHSSLERPDIFGAMTGNYSLSLKVASLSNVSINTRDFLSLSSSDMSLVISTNDGFLDVNIAGSSEHIRALYPIDEWFHLGVVWDQNACMLSLWLNGILCEQMVVDAMVCATSLAEDTSLHLGKNDHLEGESMVVTSLTIWDSPLNQDDITRIWNTCELNDVATFTWGEIQGGNVDGIKTTTPTSCGRDTCSPDPCNGHTCVSKVDGFQCVCTDDFGGADCSVNLNPCTAKPCYNGAVCVTNGTEFSCECSTGYKGYTCDEQIAPGYWSDWGSWSQCSASCDGGIQERTRDCYKPEPESKDCSGPERMAMNCNEHQCPECDPFPVTEDIEAECLEDEGTVNCTLTCYDGIYDSMPLHYYLCGPGTNYEWAEYGNETALSPFPACTEIVLPNTMTIEMHIPYEEDACVSDPQVATDAMTNQAEQVLGTSDCITNGECMYHLVIENCDSHSRKRRSLTDPKMKIAVVYDVPEIDLYIDGVFQHEEGIPYLQNWYGILVDLETLGAEMEAQVQSGGMDINVGGLVYSADSSALLLEGIVECVEGSTPTGGLCSKCTLGKYEMNRICHICEYGTYQDQEGQTFCTRCPDNMNTTFPGAKSRNSCIVAEAVDPAPGDEGVSGPLLGVFLVVTVATLILLVIGFVWHYQKRKNQSTKVNHCDNFESTENEN